MINLLRGLLDATLRVPAEVQTRFEDETLCRRCGRCCIGATRIGGRMVMIPDLPCKFLQVLPEGGSRCTVYPIRELTGFCHRITLEAVRRELFPPDCPYMAGIPGYRGKVLIPAEEFEALKPILRDLFRLVDRPTYVRPQDWRHFLHSTLGFTANT
jgi:uncharacterized protein